MWLVLKALFYCYNPQFVHYSSTLYYKYIHSEDKIHVQRMPSILREQSNRYHSLCRRRIWLTSQECHSLSTTLLDYLIQREFALIWDIRIFMTGSFVRSSVRNGKIMRYPETQLSFRYVEKQKTTRLWGWHNDQRSRFAISQSSIIEPFLICPSSILNQWNKMSLMKTFSYCIASQLSFQWNQISKMFSMR